MPVTACPHFYHIRLELILSPVLRGIAPDSKLAFNDLGPGNGIAIPEDLATRYYGYAYDVGARVHSDSWGSASTSYDYMAAQVDLYTWQHQVTPVDSFGDIAVCNQRSEGVDMQGS